MVLAVVHFLIIAGTMLLMAHELPGFYVRNFGSAMLAAVVFGLVNATLGIVLKVLTFPLILVTFGLFSLVVNAIVLTLVAFLVPGFSISGFWPALIAAVVLAGVNMIWRAATKPREREE